MPLIKILFFAADPFSAPPQKDARLLLDEDVRQLQKRVHAAPHGRSLEFHWRLAARPQDLVRALEEVRPQVVHFSGHAAEEGVVLVGPDGGPHLVEAAALTRLFQLFPGKIRLVVLNACLSQPQAHAIARVVGCAIGTRGKISDEAAITFGAGFYGAIASRKSVKRAFDEAVHLLEMKHARDKECPRLEVRPGVDPARLVLVRRGLGPIGKAVAGLALTCAALVGILRVVDRPDGPLARQPGCGVGAGGAPRMLAARPGVPTYASSAGDAASGLAAAKSLYDRGIYFDALPLFRRAARDGVPEAMGYLGIMHQRGQGTEPQRDSAARWLYEAASKQDLRAMTALGWGFQHGVAAKQSRRWAKHWYGRAAERNWTEAMLALAGMYREERQYDAALRWYQDAVHAGSIDARVEAGLMYEAGLGMPQDLAEARCLYQSAAEAGLPRGKYEMGRLYQFGIGVPQDYDHAREWYERAADAGFPDAMNSMGDLYRNGWGIPSDREQAIEWYRRAARAGLPIAQANLRELGMN